MIGRGRLANTVPGEQPLHGWVRHECLSRKPSNSTPQGESQVLTSALQPPTIYPVTPSLLGLPLELRQQIYIDVFHDQPYTERRCDVFHTRLGNIGCHCGEGLSTASSQLYSETREHFYNCARFTFKNPATCKKFLESIGTNNIQVGALALTYRNIYSELRLLWDTLGSFTSSTNLHSLELKIEAWDGHLAADAPIYLPIAQKIHSPAFFYDMSLRTTRHPLAHLKALRRLVILGHPGTGEVEEAIFKASMKIEGVAKAEGRNATKTGDYHAGISEWLYNIEVT